MAAMWHINRRVADPRVREDMVAIAEGLGCGSSTSLLDLIEAARTRLARERGYGSTIESKQQQQHQMMDMDEFVSRAEEMLVVEKEESSSSSTRQDNAPGHSSSSSSSGSSGGSGSSSSSSSSSSGSGSSDEDWRYVSSMDGETPLDFVLAAFGRRIDRVEGAAVVALCLALGSIVVSLIVATTV